MCNTLGRNGYSFLLVYFLFCSICCLIQADGLKPANSSLAVNTTNRVTFLPISDKNLSASNEANVISSLPMHSGREHIVEPSQTFHESKPNRTIPELIKPVHEEQHNLEDLPQVDEKKPVVPKKGVSAPDIFTNLTANSMDHAKVVHPKPLITESDRDYFEHNNSKENGNSLSIDQIDPSTVGSKDSSRSRYVIPIVAVILSVPLVAVIFSLLYKRGTDWWQHRNYRKMDFLVDGMYQH